MERLTERMIAGLNTAGIKAVPAMPKEKMPLLREAVAAVRIAEVQCKESGFLQYLGLRDGQELYGRALDASLQLELFTPEGRGSSYARQALSLVLNALLSGIVGLELGQIRVGDCQFDASCECFVTVVTVQCSAMCCAIASDDGSFLTDIMLRGDLK